MVAAVVAEQLQQSEFVGRKGLRPSLQPPASPAGYLVVGD